MGGSSKKTTTDSSSTSQSTLPTWATSSLQGLTNRTDALGNVDPSTYVAPASSLQNQAYSSAAGLGSNQGLFGQAASTVANGTGTNLNTGGVTSSAASANPAAGITGATANAAGNVTGATANAANNINGVTANSAGNITGANANAASLLDGGGINSYLSPYLNDVVGSALNTYDTGALQQQQALKAQAAGSGAFGDSTYGIANGLLGSQLALGRASTASNLLNTGFNTAAGLDQYDTSNRQAANLANAGYSQQANIANQSNQQATNLANANYAQQANLSNQSNQQAANMANAGYSQQANLSNQQNQQAANMANAGYSQQANLANQSNQQAANLTNAGYQQQTNQTNAAAQQAAMLANQSSQNDASARQLQAAGLLGTLGTDQGADARANAETQDTLGQDQRSIAQSQATAPISLAQAMAQLYSQNQYGLLGGSSSTQNGTQTASSNPGLLGTIGQASSDAASLAKLFG